MLKLTSHFHSLQYHLVLYKVSLLKVLLCAISIIIYSCSMYSLENLSSDLDLNVRLWSLNFLNRMVSQCAKTWQISQSSEIAKCMKLLSRGLNFRSDREWASTL